MGEVLPTLRREVSLADRFSVTRYQHTASDPRIRDELMDLTPSGKCPGGKKFNSLVYEALDLKGHEAIINFGSGDGLDEVRWVTDYGHRGPIIGLDVPSATETEFDSRFYDARQRIREEGIDNIRLIPGFAQKTELPSKSVDVVTAFSMIYYTRRPWQVFVETLRLLKDGGKAAFTSNARGNKQRHHAFLRKMDEATDTKAPPPLSSKYKAERLQRAASLYFDGLVEVQRREPIIIETPEERSIYLESIESYRPFFKPQPDPERWSAARKGVIEAIIDAEIEMTGRFTDTMARLAIIGYKPDTPNPIQRLARLGLIR